MRYAIGVLAVVLFSGAVTGNALAGEVTVNGNVATKITGKAQVENTLKVKLSDTVIDFGKLTSEDAKEKKIDITVVQCNASGAVPTMKIAGAANLKSVENKTIDTKYGLRLSQTGAVPYVTAASFNHAGRQLKKSGVSELWARIVPTDAAIGTYSNEMTVTFSQTM